MSTRTRPMPQVSYFFSGLRVTPDQKLKEIDIECVRSEQVHEVEEPGKREQSPENMFDKETSLTNPKGLEDPVEEGIKWWGRRMPYERTKQRSLENGVKVRHTHDDQRDDPTLKGLCPWTRQNESGRW